MLLLQTGMSEWGCDSKKNFSKISFETRDEKKSKKDSDFYGMAVLFSSHFAPCQFGIGMRSNSD